MAPASVAQSIVLYTVGLQGQPAGNENSLINVVRHRLNTRFQDDLSEAVLLKGFLFGIAPIVDYLRASLGDELSHSIDQHVFADHVHRLFEIIATRTKLVRRFSPILESEDHWTSVVPGLQLALRGAPLVAPA